jgi:hypothetical protein
MANGHFGLNGAYGIDPVSELQRWHREREAQMARQERAERWIADKFAGKTYYSRERFENDACALVTTLYGRALSADEHALIIRSCRSLFHGLVDPAVFAGKITVVRGESITFTAA